MNNTDEISIREIIISIKDAVSYLRKRLILILLVIVLGGALGLYYATSQPMRYVAKLSFVVEESRSGGAGGLASIAGQFGFDLGGGSGGGVLSADNILLFLKSESLCKETLTSRFDSNSNDLMADKYAEMMKLKDQWKANKDIGVINFSKYPDGQFPRIEDSLLQSIVGGIIKANLLVSKPDKRASIILVKTIFDDEMFSKFFCERLVEIATDRYVYSKTKYKVLNVARLQKKADSLSSVLNNITYTTAESQQSLVDVNPGIRIAPIKSEINARDKVMAAAIFAEVVKSLELSKTILNQETPVIQVVDQSSLPLTKKFIEKSTGFTIGAILGLFLVVSFLLTKRWFKSVM